MILLHMVRNPISWSSQLYQFFVRKRVPSVVEWGAELSHERNRDMGGTVTYFSTQQNENFSRGLQHYFSITVTADHHGMHSSF